MAFWKSPCMLEEGWTGDLNLALWANQAGTGCIDRNVAAEPRGAELFAFRFSGCLDKQNSLFLLRSEGAEPQGWKVERGHGKNKVLSPLGFLPQPCWLCLGIGFVPETVLPVCCLEAAAFRTHLSLVIYSFCFTKTKQVIMPATSAALKRGTLPRETKDPGLWVSWWVLKVFERGQEPAVIRRLMFLAFSSQHYSVPTVTFRSSARWWCPSFRDTGHRETGV